jgi:hypothetical protein
LLSPIPYFDVIAFSGPASAPAFVRRERGAA